MNSSTVLADPRTPATILCPYEGRRTSKEVWVKLFVVHFTTIAALCHVLSIRRERIFSWRLVFYFLVPYSAFAYQGLALAALSIAVLYYTFKRNPLGNGGILDSAVRFFLGLIPEDEPAYGPVPASSAPHEDSETETETSWKRIGRPVVACAFLAQCIGTIVVYLRRQAHDAVTQADGRMLELGSTGIITAMYWIAISAKVKPFSQSIPVKTPGERTTIDVVMVLLRDSQTKHLKADDQKMNPHLRSFLQNGAVCLFALVLARQFPLFPMLADLLSVWLVHLITFVFCSIYAYLKWSAHKKFAWLLFPIGTPIYVALVYLFAYSVVVPIFYPNPEMDRTH